MGQVEGKLKREEIEDLQKTTHFTKDEIKQIYYHFSLISNAIDQDNLIQEEEFQAALGIKNTELARRIFNVFDTNADGNIEFSEFVKTLSSLSPKASLDEKLKFSFRLYDKDNDGTIDKKELISMVKASVVDNQLINLSDEQIEELVDNTFKEVDINNDGHISYEEYKKMVEDKPALLDYLTITVMPEPGDEWEELGSSSPEEPSFMNKGSWPSSPNRSASGTSPKSPSMLEQFVPQRIVNALLSEKEGKRRISLPWSQNP